MTWSVSLELEIEPESIRAARRLVRAAAELAGAPADEAGEIEIAAGEGLAHAYRRACHTGARPVQVQMEFDGVDFSITIHDQDVGPAPPAPPATPPPRTDPQGLGLYVMSRMMDAFEVLMDAHGRGAAVRMVKRVHAAP